MDTSGMDIVIDPWKKLVIHEVIEYKLQDYVNVVLTQARAVGGGNVNMNWTNGVVFSFAGFPDTESIVKEKLNGVLHWSSVLFAIKDRYERQIIRENGTVNLADVGANEIFSKLADILKARSKFVAASAAS